MRVAGRSATAVRVIGVDLRHRDLAEVPDERVRAAEAAVRDAERALAEIDGEDAADRAREELLGRLARRSGDRLAVALADGRVGTARIGEVGAAVAAQLIEVAQRRRGHAERRGAAQRAWQAAQAELDRLHGSGRQRREAVISVEAEAEAELELELSYVVLGAGWSSAYDARLDPDGAERLDLTWFGMIVQATGEDWPECELTLSTARPAVSVTVPELEPWWVDVRRPPEPMLMAAVADASVGGAARRERALAPMPVEAVPAEPMDGTVAGSWRLARPTAVPGDGTPHRTTVAAFALPVRLDHVIAPALGPDAHLRATAQNDTGQVLLTGRVSTFADDAFVGTTTLPQTAPGADIELALGVDDRVVVERELAERVAHKARFSSARGAVERWTITVQNRRTAPARVLVRDRVPVSRHADIKIVDVALTPEPAERDELGRVEWSVTIEPDRSWQASIRVRRRAPQGDGADRVELTGHRPPPGQPGRNRTCCGPSSSTLFTPISCSVRTISPVRICTALATPRPPRPSARTGRPGRSACRARRARPRPAASAPCVIPVSTYTSARSPTACTTGSTSSRGTGARSSWRPPWLESSTASTPASTTRWASSTLWIPLIINLPGQVLRSHSTSAMVSAGSNTRFDQLGHRSVGGLQAGEPQRLRGDQVEPPVRVHRPVQERAQRQRGRHRQPVAHIPQPGAPTGVSTVSISVS